MALSLLYTLIELAGIITAVKAVRDSRTPQGAIAWAIALVTFPLLTLPLYWIFGRNKFQGYVEAMRTGESRINELVTSIREVPRVKALSERRNPGAPRCAFETLAAFPYLDGNDVELLIDGHATFSAILRYIEEATSYVHIQFFIVKDDSIGNKIRNLLMAKAQQGVRVRFLYDEIGSHSMPDSFWDKMREAGIEIFPFKTTKGRGNRFQLNFRNHRKIVVIDGHTVFIGGHNIGDEYLGKSKKFEAWRDTHIRITGPAAIGARISFAKDWYWATGVLHDLDLALPSPAGDMDVLTLPTGPVDNLESCSLMFIRAINAATKRLWISSPYYVPDSAVTKALQLAAMRGVDVRIMLPHKADHLLVYFAGFACLKDLDLPGIRVYRYMKGFLHQKAFLVDDQIAAVGTANLDNRSFRLNFEITALVEDSRFCKEIEKMFRDDFARCKETGPNEYYKKSIVTQTVIKIARLLSPIL